MRNRLSAKCYDKKLIPLQETTTMMAVLTILELEIQLKDNEPVQKNYISIPKPLYGEVKEYLEDLISSD